MALRMAQPWSHPKTRVFWFRRAVPRDLRDLIGKREELASLNTKDPDLARVRYAKVSAEVEARWANLQTGTRTLTEGEAHTLARPVHDEWIQVHQADPTFQLGWQVHLYPTLWTATPLPEIAPQKGVPGEMPITNVFYRSMRRRCFEEADELLTQHGLVVDDWSRTKLARAVSAALQRASLTISRAALGEIELGDSPAHDSAEVVDGRNGGPSYVPRAPARLASQPEAGKPLSLTGLFEAWWQEAKAVGRKPSTHESYEKTIRY